jgi:hypothetical protein
MSEAVHGIRMVMRNGGPNCVCGKEIINIIVAGEILFTHYLFTHALYYQLRSLRISH